MKALIAIVARHPVLPNLMMCFIFIAGVWSFLDLKRESTPRIGIDMATITVSYPGVSAKEIEEGIILKIEQAIQGVQGIKKVDARAVEGLASFTIELKEGGNNTEILKDLKEKVEHISNFPKDAEIPKVQEIISTRPIALVLLHGEASERTLRELAYDIKDEFFLLGISQVSVGGVRDYEISIHISREKLNAYNLSFEQVAQIIQATSLNIPGGSIQTKMQEYKIEIKGRRYTAKDYKDIVIVAKENGAIIKLHHIAKVYDGFEEEENYGSYNGKRAVNFIISKTEDEDSIELATKIKKFIQHKKLPTGIKLVLLTDYSKDIQDRINLLLTNAIQGFILLFFVLWFFLNFRLSFWIVMGIPISFAFSGLLLGAAGHSLNMINLFGLILVLGIVVDDAIVIGENIYRHQQEESDLMQASISGTYEMAFPVMGAISTTIVAFMPLLFMKGILGKFIAVLPFVVIATLIGSLIEGLFILPAHLGHSKKKEKKIPKLRQMIDKFIARIIDTIYSPLFKVCLNWRYTAIALALCSIIICGGMIKGGFLPYVLFPETDTLSLKAVIIFPEGTPITQTKRAVSHIENTALMLNKTFLKKYGKEFITGVYSEVGSGGNKTNEGSIFVNLVGPETRTLHSKDILNMWREKVGPIRNSFKTNFAAFGGGGLPTKDIEILLKHNDLNFLNRASLEIQQELRNYKGIYNIESDFKPGKQELHLSLKPQARLLGITLQDLGRQINQGFYGLEVFKVQRGRDEIKIEIKYPKHQRLSLKDLYDKRIRTSAGLEIPFIEVATITQKRGVSEILRQNGKRRIKVMADVNENWTTAEEVLAHLEKHLFSKIRQNYTGLMIDIAGTQQENKVMMKSLLKGFLFALFGIYAILAFIFKSYLQPLLIMLSIPLGLVGAFAGHYIMGYELTILSLFGLVALTGVVVNDALVLINKINKLQIEGNNTFESVLNAGALRFRAIIITSLTTVAGLSPLLMEKSFQAQFLKPMALSLASGLAFATLLTLFIIPCFYLVMNDFRRLIRFLIKGSWPSPEEVEPASQNKL